MREPLQITLRLARCVFPEGCPHAGLEIVHSVRAGEAGVAKLRHSNISSVDDPR
jgi:hypothetical protein